MENNDIFQHLNTSFAYFTSLVRRNWDTRAISFHEKKATLITVRLITLLHTRLHSANFPKLFLPKHSWVLREAACHMCPVFGCGVCCHWGSLSVSLCSESLLAAHVQARRRLSPTHIFKQRPQTNILLDFDIRFGFYLPPRWPVNWNIAKTSARLLSWM